LTYEALKKQIARADDDGATASRETTPPAGERRAPRRVKSRKKHAPSSSRRARRRKTQFVELSATQLLGAAPTKCTVVEVEDKSGVRMIVRLLGETAIDDVARLIAVFGRREPERVDAIELPRSARAPRQTVGAAGLTMQSARQRRRSQLGARRSLGRSTFDLLTNSRARRATPDTGARYRTKAPKLEPCVAGASKGRQFVAPSDGRAVVLSLPF
jgi:hypothetical protein